MRSALLVLSPALVGCTDSTTPKPCTAASSGPLAASGGPEATFDDPWVERDRMNGSTFIEIAEVRVVDDTTALFCSGVKGLNVVDIRDPGSPSFDRRITGSLSSGSYPRCQHLAVDGDRVVVTNRGDEIQPTPFITLVDLAGDQELATYTEEGRTFEGVAMGGGRLYAAMHQGGVRVLDVGAQTLTPRGTLGGLENAWGVALRGDRLYVADGVGGLVVADVADPDAPAILGRAPTGGFAQSVELSDDGTHAFVAAGGAGLVVVDVQDAAAPSVVATVDTPGNALQVALAEGYAYIADWNDARAVDVRDPAAPVLIATERLEVPSGLPRVLGIGAWGRFAYLGEWTGLHAMELFPERAAPDVAPETRSLDIGAVDDGGTLQQTLSIANVGRAQATVWDIEVAGAPGFSVEPRQLSIAPGAAQPITIRYAAPDAYEAGACLTLRSDDPDEPALGVGIAANRPLVGVGADAPEVEVRLLGGGPWKLSEHRGEVVVLAYFATF